ncbi:MAG: tetratricopeptide repeat protein [Myxococcota bacterium]
MGRPQATMDAAAIPAKRGLVDEQPEGTRTQVAILVALFVGIGVMTGVAISLGAFGGPGQEEFGWTKPRGVDPKGVARAKSLKAGAAASVDSLLAPVADSMLEEALRDLPEGLAEASGSNPAQAAHTEAPPTPSDVYHDLRDADGKAIPSTPGAKSVTFGGMPEVRPKQGDSKREAAGASVGANAEPDDAAAAGRARKAEAPAAKPTSAIPAANVGAALNTARRQMGAGAPDQAIEGFRAVLAADPTSSKARLGLAQALYESNRTTEARGEVKRLLEAEPTHGRALLLMGSIAQEQGPVSEAKAYYKLYLKHYPTGTSSPEVRAILDRL